MKMALVMSMAVFAAASGGALEIAAGEDATAEIQARIDAAFLAGGGEVRIPEGTHHVRGLRLRSGVMLHLERGAVLLASRDTAAYDDVFTNDAVEPLPVGDDNASGMAMNRYNRAVIRLHGATGASIIGEPGSAIDGDNGFNPDGEERYRGVHAICATDSTNLLFRGFEVRHAGNWAFRMVRCSNLVFERLTVLAGHDGVHCKACRNVRVEDCFLHTGDDCVAGYANEDLEVRRCDLSSACNILRLGGRRILVEHCVAHGPCEYVFRGSLTPEQKRDGLWDPDTVAGRHSTATFFLYFGDVTMPNPEGLVPGDILIRDCRVRNVARLIRYNHGHERWQRGLPLQSLRMERIEASGLSLPCALVGGIGEKRGEWPLDFEMSDCSLSFSEPVEEVFSCANVRSMALSNVAIAALPAADGAHDGRPPLVRSWDGATPELRLSGVSGADEALAFGDGGAWRCPMRRAP